MFPLGSVLLPGGVLPLHVFEPRYRAMVQECLARTDHEFGVVLIERGFEVGGGDFRCMAGTVARMVQVAVLEDGGYALVTIGTRRIRVNGWLPDDPYPLADVDDWPDEDDAVSPDELAARIAATWGRVRRVNAMAAELGDEHADATAQIADDPLVASYHLSALAPLGPADQQRLLTARGPSERIDLLEAALDDAEALQQFRLQHPSNGTSFNDDFDGS